MSDPAPSATTTRHWWFSLPSYARLAFIAASAAWFFDCFDQQIFNLARMDAVIALAGPDKAKEFAPYTMSAFLIGWGIGGLWLGALGDRIGRVRMLAICILLYGVFTGLSSFSFSIWDFSLYRVLTGVGVGGVFGLAISLISDVVPGAGRPKALGTFQALSTIGNVCAGLTGLALSQAVISGQLAKSWEWKTLFLVGAIPALVTGALCLFLREPAGWIAARDSGQLKAAKAGSYLALFSDPRWRKHALLGLGLCSVGIIGLWGLGNFSQDILPSVLEKHYAEAGLAGDELKGHISRMKSFAMMAQNLGGFIGMMGLAWIAHRFGRRIAFAIGFVAATATTMLMFKGMRTFGDIWWMIPLMGAAQYSLFAAYAIYLPELFPGSLRSTGSSFCYNCGRFVAATAPFTLAILTKHLSEGKASAEKIEAFRSAGFWVSCVMLLGLLIIPFVPETKDKPLPE